MKSSREQFEEWWEGWFGESPLSGWSSIKTIEGYAPEIINAMWQSWQASRQALANEEVTTAPFVKVE